ncbi:hypothetical protein QCE81_36730 [Caballeronia sp. LZ002]|uniref:hypothetical protein n=1 Tax=Caballeronia sp. LZ002 TaxID=3038558 RepID=UPI0028563100|nr:hypothetical protein [Caballeronia sp. LZ002]MDR5777365.1 hypothetical protein [Caballeronia sp. LZ002]MDR5852803.1 hypothetical protein [Caballeronia sp. LZ003]
MHDIANRDSAASAELLSASAHVADELAKERDSAVLSTVISDLRGTSAVSSLSMVAAILDATAYVADIRHSLKELSEHELPADVQCILHDMADEMYCRDHAKSTAEWISDSAA